MILFSLSIRALIDNDFIERTRPMTNTQTKERLVDARTIAVELLGISKRSFWRLRAQGKIGPKPVKVGGSLRWRLSSILKWIEWDCCDAAEFQAREEQAKC